MTKIKTVYVLGAGFSIEAGAPSQEKIVSKIFEIHEREPIFFGEKKIAKFKSFLQNTLNISENYQKTIPLEDIFTPLDSCIANNISFRNVDVEGLKKSRQLVFELIGLTLQYILQYSNKEYIDIFSKYLVQESKKRLQSKQDFISIISTNWDILLDNSIYNEISNQGDLGVVDYCCYISSYDKLDNTVKPGLEILGNGGFNTKLLKLHGSLNWLQCPKCQRIYVKFNQKIAMNPFYGINKPRCRHCDENFYKTKAHNLQANLIMPTFLKDLSNPQYKIIWQNAGIELSEAKKIIFIGYSLPQADFEMRQLLSRMVDSRTEIEVVDYKDEHHPERFNLLLKNYEQFFGRKIKSYNLGTSNYIITEIKQRIDNNTRA